MADIGVEPFMVDGLVDRDCKDWYCQMRQRDRDPESIRGAAIGGESALKREIARRLRQEMTEPERLLWQHLRANRLDGIQFRRQTVIEGFIVDFYCPRYRLVVEVDGDVHDLQKEYDDERTEILSRLGLTIVRFTNDDVTLRAARVVRELRRAISSIQAGAE